MSFDWVAFLGKLFAHADKLDDILDLIQRINGAIASKDFGEALEAIFELGKLLLLIFTSTTSQSFGDEATACACFEAQRFGDGKLLERLKSFIESPLGQILLELLLKGIMKPSP